MKANTPLEQLLDFFAKNPKFYLRKPNEIREASGLDLTDKQIQAVVNELKKKVEKQ